MTRKEYNGWTNYETWNVALWLNNDEGSESYWCEAADEALRYRHNDADGAASQLSCRLKDEVTENAPDLGASCYADLLGAALSEVDWYAIAEHYIADAKERVEA